MRRWVRITFVNKNGDIIFEIDVPVEALPILALVIFYFIKALFMSMQADYERVLLLLRGHL